MAQPPFELHVEFDLIERHVTGTFDHHLAAVAPCALGELAERLELGELGAVGGVGQPAGAQSVADRKRDVVAAQDLADLVPELVHEVLAAVMEHPLREQRSAARDDPDQPVLHERQVLAQHAGVDREVVDALARLVLERVEHGALVELLDPAAHDHRVDRHGADRNARVLDDRIARGVEVAARGEIHHRVGAPALGPVELLDLLVGAARYGRRAHVRVDLGGARSADRHRVEPVREVHLVRGDHHAARGHLVAHHLGREMGLALRDALHLRRHGAEPRMLELGNRDEAHGRTPAPVGALRPVARHEVPGAVRRRRRHARRVGRAERERSAQRRRVREAARRRALAAARRVRAAAR
jgi:hypothetical protein